MIVKIKHKSLRRFYETGNGRGLQIEILDRLENILTALDVVVEIGELRTIPSWRLHKLSGDLKGFWSLSVTKNWRIVFRFENGDVSDVDLVDYH